MLELSLHSITPLWTWGRITLARDALGHGWVVGTWVPFGSWNADQSTSNGPSLPPWEGLEGKLGSLG